MLYEAVLIFANTVEPGVSKPINSKQPGVSKLFAAYQLIYSINLLLDSKLLPILEKRQNLALVNKKISCFLKLYCLKVPHSIN